MRGLAPVLAVVVVLASTGCGLVDGVFGEKGGCSQYFSTADGSIELCFPSGWHESGKDHPYDLSCFSRSKDMMTGVFVYTREDLARGYTPQALLQEQIADIRSKRERFTIMGKQTTTAHDGKRLTTAVYSAEKGGEAYYYRFTLIEFVDNPDVVAVALQNTFPSDWAENEPILDGITRSARLTR